MQFNNQLSFNLYLLTWTIRASLSIIVASDSKTMSGSFTTPWTEIFIWLPWEGNGAASTWLEVPVVVITSLSSLCKGPSPSPVAGPRTRTGGASNDVWLAIVAWRCRWWYKSDDGVVKNSSKGSRKGKFTKMVAFCKEMSTANKEQGKLLNSWFEDKLKD